MAKRTWPLTQRAGPARKATTSAMSDGSPRRSRGAACRSRSTTSWGLPSRKSGVAVGPGATALTVASRPRSSRARISVSPSTAAFGGDVGCVGRHRGAGHARRERDDRTALSDSPSGLLGDDEAAPDVLAVHAVEVVEVEVDDAREHHAPGGVDDDVHAAELVLDALERRRHRVFVCDVADDGEGSTSGETDGVGCLLGPGLVAGVVDGDVEPSAARRSTTARPMPPEPLVTSATRAPAPEVRSGVAAGFRNYA